MADLVFPAQAGVILAKPPGAGTPDGIPRASGGDPVEADWNANALAYSPRKRG